MPKARVDGIPQINGNFIYGAISIENFPDGTQAGQIPYWDGVQWRLIRLVGGGGMDIAFDAANNVLEIYYADNRVYDTFTADAILFATVSATFTANSILLGTVQSSFTADAELV